jgi:hypothetical protein
MILVMLMVSVQWFGERQGNDAGLRDAGVVTGSQSAANVDFRTTLVDFPECKSLSEELQQNLILTSSDRSEYFVKLREHTALTGGSDFGYYHGHGQSAFSLNFSALDSSSFTRSLPPAIFIGDSITREIALRYRAIMPTRDQLQSQSLQLDWSPRPDLDPGGPAVEAVLRCKFPIFFVGGNGLWAMDYRVPAPTSKQLKVHMAVVEQMVERMKCLESATNSRGAYITSMPVDMGKFRDTRRTSADYRELKAWAASEEKLLSRESVAVLRSHILAQQCPGVRCDGIHFGSAFRRNNCSRSAQLWDRLLVDLMDNRLPPPQHAAVCHDDGSGGDGPFEERRVTYIMCCMQAGVGFT